MSDSLRKKYQEKRRVENLGRITNNNRQKAVKLINKYSAQYPEYREFKLNSKSSINDINNMKKLVNERIGYDVLTSAIREGNNITAEMTAKSLKNSNDEYTKRLAKYAEQLANAKRRSGLKLTDEEKEYLERGNGNILGYGNESIVSLFENTRTDKQAKGLIERLKNQDVKQEFIDKQVMTFDRIFRKIEGVREEDLNVVREYLLTQPIKELGKKVNDLLLNLETYSSGSQMSAGARDEEQELANARLSDVMFKYGLNKKASEKLVKKDINKVLKQHKKK